MLQVDLSLGGLIPVSSSGGSGGRDDAVSVQRRWSADPTFVMAVLALAALVAVVVAPGQSVVLVLLAVVAAGLSLSGST